MKSAICAIPGVGTIGCAFVWGATIVAKKVVNKIGRCPKARHGSMCIPKVLNHKNVEQLKNRRERIGNKNEKMD